MRMRAAIITAIVAAAFFAQQALPARAQLIAVSRDYLVVAVDPGKNQIKVSSLDGKSDAGTVIVSPETKLFVLSQPVPTFSWRLLQKGMKISVKGGMTWGLQVKARQIFVL